MCCVLFCPLNIDLCGNIYEFTDAIDVNMCHKKRQPYRPDFENMTDAELDRWISVRRGWSVREGWRHETNRAVYGLFNLKRDRVGYLEYTEEAAWQHAPKFTTDLNAAWELAREIEVVLTPGGDSPGQTARWVAEAWAKENWRDG